MCLGDCEAIDNNKDECKYFFILNNFYKLMITFPFKSKILIYLKVRESMEPALLSPIRK